MRLPRRVQTWLVLAAMALFVAWFGAYAVRLHDAHRTAKSDLGQIDLAIWNTSRGRLLQEIKDETISTRLTDHVEPIFLPVSVAFWLWDDVRALLWLQAAALALGAWPVYLLARRWLGRALCPAAGTPDVSGRRADLAAWGGSVFALAYLLSPALQVAAVSEFHALPLAPPLIAWAFWSVEQRQWARFTLAAFLLANVQEGMALLTALLGLHATFRAWRASSDDRHDRMRGIAAGIGTFLFGCGWFYVTTFAIIPRFASEAYGVSATPYAARYGTLGDSFGDVLRALVTRPGAILHIALEPLRLRYIFGLLAPVAFLALLAPDVLILAAPLFLANLLSSYPLQYSGQLHYSAPLVPYVAVAGALGLSRLIRMSRRALGKGFVIPAVSASQGMAVKAYGIILAVVLLAALSWQAAAGHSPIGREYRLLAESGWTQVTPHHELLRRFAAQIPAGSPLSATTDLYPHLSHRELIYRFPWLGEARQALVDVSGNTDVHPVEMRDAIDGLLASGWGLTDAADGYLLLSRGQGAAEIPDEFASFARAPAAAPQYPLDITYGGVLRLLGYDLVHDLKWRKTQLHLYWQALEPLPDGTEIAVQILEPSGEVVDDTAVRPMPAVVWYPPDRWRTDEIVLTTTLPWYLPVEWAPVVGVRRGDEQLVPSASSAEVEVTADGRVRLPAWAWRDGRPAPLKEPPDVHPDDARFTGDGWAVSLTGHSLPGSATAGERLPVKLRWQADAPAPRNYTVFVQLRDAQSRTVASGDGTPTWFTPRRTDRWPAGGYTTWDAHTVELPDSLPAGDYQIIAGWYDLETGTRLALLDAAGNAAGDEAVIGMVRVETEKGPTADLCCATVPECCASLE
jgi:uncharacterized membrane protein